MNFQIVVDEDGNTKLQVVEQVEKKVEYTKKQLEVRLDDLKKAIEAYTAQKEQIEEMLKQFPEEDKIEKE